MSHTPGSQVAKLAWDKQLTPRTCLVVSLSMIILLTIICKQRPQNIICIQLQTDNSRIRCYYIYFDPQYECLIVVVMGRANSHL